MTPATTAREVRALARLLAAAGPLKITRIEVELARRGEPAYSAVLRALLTGSAWFAAETPGNKQTRWTLTAKGRAAARRSAAAVK